jgi:hypothetical protein
MVFGGTSIWRGRSTAEIRSEHFLVWAGWTQEAASVPRDACVLPADPHLAANGESVVLGLQSYPTVRVTRICINSKARISEASWVSSSFCTRRVIVITVGFKFASSDVLVNLRASRVTRKIVGLRHTEIRKTMLAVGLYDPRNPSDIDCPSHCSLLQASTLPSDLSYTSVQDPCGPALPTVRAD